MMIYWKQLQSVLLHKWYVPIEFPRYARYKYGNGTNEEWAIGWLHHLHYVSILPMPEVYVREMLADMHATSKEVTGSWDIANWLNQNGPNIHFHDDTITLIDKIMKEVGYVLTDNCDWSWVASPQFKSWAGEQLVSSEF